MSKISEKIKCPFCGHNHTLWECKLNNELMKVKEKVKYSLPTPEFVQLRAEIIQLRSRIEHLEKLVESISK